MVAATRTPPRSPVGLASATSEAEEDQALTDLQQMSRCVFATHVVGGLQVGEKLSFGAEAEVMGKAKKRFSDHPYRLARRRNHGLSHMASQESRTAAMSIRSFYEPRNQ